MLLWIIIAVIAAIVVLIIVLGRLSTQEEIKEMTAGEGTSLIRFAAATTLSTLLEFIARGDDDPAHSGRIDRERIFPTALLAGRKVFGETFTEEILKDELKAVVKNGPDHLAKMQEHMRYENAKKLLSIESKDKVILSSLTALQLNFQEPVAELLPLRQFAHEFYGDPVEVDRRMTGAVGAVSLTETSIALSNAILHDLSAASGPAGSSHPPGQEQAHD